MLFPAACFVFIVFVIVIKKVLQWGVVAILHTDTIT
jgi:hypothetical protein